MFVEFVVKPVVVFVDGEVCVFGIVDDIWCIDHVSSMVIDLFGYFLEEFVGGLLTNVVYYDDILEILMGFVCAHHGKLDMLIWVWLLRFDGSW